MLLRLALGVGLAATLFASIANAEGPKEVKTQKGKAVPLGNITSQPASCSSGSGPIPVPQLSVKPSHGTVFLQSILSDLAATDSCPARKIPSILLLYVPNSDFIGVDSVQLSFEAGNKPLPTVSFRITVD